MQLACTGAVPDGFVSWATHSFSFIHTCARQAQQAQLGMYRGNQLSPSTSVVSSATERCFLYDSTSLAVCFIDFICIGFRPAKLLHLPCDVCLMTGLLLIVDTGRVACCILSCVSSLGDCTRGWRECSQHSALA